MKPTSTILLICLFSVISYLPGQAQAPEDFTFSIHLGTFVKAQLSDFDNIRPLGFVYSEKFRSNLLQIYLGEFTSEAAAGKVLSQVKAKGYPDAYVMRRNLQQGDKVYIIELSRKNQQEQIDWLQYLNAGPLYAVIDKNQVKVVTGVFDNQAEAQQRLAIVSRLGYDKAVVNAVNNIYLHAISPFEAGGQLDAPQVELVVEAPKDKTQPKPVEEDVIPLPASISTASSAPEKPQVVPATASTPPVKEKPAKESTPPPAEVIPESYDEVLVARSPVVEQVKRISEPDIRLKVKRTSAIELQKVLKTEGTYTGSLDGFYGNGTKAGYQKFMAAHPYINKYKILANNQDQWTAKGGNDQDDLFAEWQSLQLLHVIAQELDPNPALSKSLSESYSQVRKDLYSAKKPLSAAEQKAIIDWNTSLWTGLDAWAAKDPIHPKMITPLRVAYYQSMVLLEDYFMDKKFQPLEAKGLALSVLQTMIAPYLESYRP